MIVTFGSSHIFVRRVSDLHLTSIARDCLCGHRPWSKDAPRTKKVPILSHNIRGIVGPRNSHRKMPKATDSDITAATNTPPVTQLSTFARGQMPTMPFANFPQYPQVRATPNVSADAWPRCLSFMGYAPRHAISWQCASLLPVRAWFPNTMKPRSPPYRNAHRQLHGCRVLRVV